MSISAIQSQMAEVSAEIRAKELEKEEYENKIAEIEDAIAEVESASSAVENTEYSNTFNYVKQNCGLPTTNGTTGSSKNYWIVQDSNGQSYGDVVSFGNALDELTTTVSDVSTSMTNVMSKATEKIEEYNQEIMRLNEEISALQSQYNNLSSELQAAKAAEEENKTNTTEC